MSDNTKLGIYGIRIRKANSSDIVAKEQLKEIFNDPEAGYIGFLIRNNLVEQIDKRTFCERGGRRPEEVGGFVAESDGRIVGILLYDFGKIYSFVRGKRDISFDFGKNVVGNPNAPEILRMPITPLESILIQKWEKEGEDFLHDVEKLKQEDLYSEDERQNYHFLDIVENRLRERRWLGPNDEMLDENKETVIKGFIKSRKFFREVLRLEEEVDHDYEERFDIPHTSTGEILILGVHSSYRRRGIASVLVEKTMDVFKEGQAVFVVVKTWKDNIAAQRLYEKFGFKKLYEFKKDGERDICMINSLYEKS